MSRGRILALLVGAVCLSSALAQAQTVLNQKDVPIRIKKSGSYVLGSNLKVTDPTVTAIRVAANDVTIDLNGFTIEGPPAGPTSHGAAILNVAGGEANVVVKNGTVRGFSIDEAACIHLSGGGGAGSHRVENVHVQACGGHGIYADGVVIHCQVTRTDFAIGAGEGSVVTDNTVYWARYRGIHTNTRGLSGTNDGTKSGGVVVARNNIYAQDAGTIA
jgi:hypothetical protein